MKVVLFAVGLARASTTIPKAPKAYDPTVDHVIKAEDLTVGRLEGC